MSSMGTEESKEGKKPVGQDMAISNLLEIGFKEQQSSSIWQYNKERMKGKERNWSMISHLTKACSNGTYTSKLPPSSSFSNTQKNDTPPQLSSKKGECPFNKGQYWSSKITWNNTTQYVNRQYSSQPKLNKKYTFGYQVNGRKRRGREDESIYKDQYKANLIYSVMNHRDIIKYKEKEMRKDNKSIDKSKSIDKAKVNSCTSNQQMEVTPANTQQHPLGKKDSGGYEEGEGRSLMMIRQLLMDLQFIKNYANQPQSCEKKVRVNRWSIKKSMVKIQ